MLHLNNFVNNTSLKLFLWLMGFYTALAVTAAPTSQINSNSLSSNSIVDEIIAEAKALESQDIRQAINLMLKREKEVVQTSSAGQLAAFYNKLSELHATINSIKKQQSYAQKGLNLIGQETVAIAADLHYNLGLSYESQADLLQAKNHYVKGLDIAEQTGHLLYQGRGKLFLAAIHSREGDYDLALNTIKQAYGYAKKLNDIDFDWEVYNEMSIFYSNLNDSTQALEFGLKALEAAKALKITTLEIVALHNIAYQYLNMDEYDTASIYFDRMLELSKTTGDESDLYNAYKGFALVAEGEKQYERALSYIDKAKEYLPAVEAVMVEVEFYLIKARVFNGLEQSNQALDQISIAEQTLPREQRGIKSRMGLTLLREKSTYHGELGQYRRAYDLLKEYSEGLRKYNIKRNNEAMRKLRVSFDVERSQIRNDMLEKDNKIKSLQLQQVDNEKHIQTFFLVALAILSLGLIIVMYRQFHARRQLKLFAQTDSLTGLFNRGYAFAKGRQMVELSQLERSSLCILMFDVDHFKQVNDNYGHPAGDQVLRELGEITLSCVRESDLIARFGGEEFIALLPNVDIETAEFIAARIKDKLQQAKQQFNDTEFSVTASFGVASLSESESFEHLIKRVDEALYQAKENGRNCIVVAGDG